MSIAVFMSSDEHAPTGGGFNFGYQLLITNPAQEALIQFLNDSYAETHGVRQDRAGLEVLLATVHLHQSLLDFSFSSYGESSCRRSSGAPLLVR